MTYTAHFSYNTACNRLGVFATALADQQHSFGNTVLSAQPVVHSSNTHSSWAASNTQLYAPVLLPLRCSSQQVPALLHLVLCCWCTGPTSPGIWSCLICSLQPCLSTSQVPFWAASTS